MAQKNYEIEYRDIEELIKKLNILDKCEATKKLTEFYVNARFKLSQNDFERYYVDGSNDGGIDFYFKEDITYFIFQTKFSGLPKAVSIKEVSPEIGKIINTITINNPNQKADDFVNTLKRELNNNDAILEIVWLTTNIIKQPVMKSIQEKLDAIRKNNGWKISIDFVVRDKFVLEGDIYNVQLGYIPYTGKKSIMLEKRQFI